MSRSRSRSTVRLARKATVAGAVATVATQAAVAGSLIAVDAVRKRRRPPSGGFPRTDPRSVQIADSRLTTYTYGEHLFGAMLEAIRGARDHVYLASYIWKGDAVGQEFKDALIEAAGRGVRVFVVFDGFANLVVSPAFKRFPETLQVLKFPTIRPGLPMLDLRRAGRDHRKVLVVDGRVGFVGGYNIGGLYATKWRDTHMRVEGPAVWELENSFIDFWNRHRHRRQPGLADVGAASWDARVRARRNEPSRMLFPVRGMYLEAIDRATERVWITQGYFIPDTEILDALLAAARRGVDVRVLMPEVSNHVVADWVARGFYTALLRGGVQIWLYEEAMVHAKTATIDGRWTTVGTANIDRLSLIGNYEINLEVHDEAQAAVMEEVFRTDLANCRRLTLAQWEQRGVLARASERVLAPLHPLL